MVAELKVRFNDVSAAYEEQRAEIDRAIADVVARGDFINGRDVAEFEREFARYCGCPYAVGTSNGTSALHLALLAIGVEPGDEVITTPMTFIATAEAITQAHAKVVFADIDPNTLNLSPAAVARAITPRTRAILFVHLHGNPAGLEEVADIARSHSILLLEDCAQAHGALLSPKASARLSCDKRTDGRAHVGSLGIAATYSFFPAKNLGAFGDAGALTTGDELVAAQARKLANHGRAEKYLHDVEGFNYRLDTLQAAVLRVKLKGLDAHVERRNRLAATYEEQLQGLPLTLQQTEAGARHGRHLFVVHTHSRDQLQEHLKQAGIETGIHYPLPLHLQRAYAHLKYTEGSMPAAESAARTTLSLPLYAQLPETQVHYVCDTIRSFYGGT